MKLAAPALLLLLTSTVFSQNFSIRDIKSNGRYGKTPTILYPVITLENKAIEKSVNTHLREALFPGEDSSLSIKKMLSNQTSDYGLSTLSYEVMFSNHGILSIKFFLEGCGTYCSSSYACINIDLKTGNKITINDLIKDDSLKAFEQIVFTLKLKALDHYKQEELKIDTSHGMDSTTYEWALTQLNDCRTRNARIDQFYLMQDKIEFIDPCEFPHAIRAFEPMYQLVFDYQAISAYIKTELNKILVPH